MGSLRDQLNKHGLADEKRARRVRQEEQNRRKQVGADGVAAEEQQREAERRAAAERKKQEDRERDASRLVAAEHEQEEGRVGSLIRDHRLDGASTAGNRKFYFITRENTVSFLEFSVPAIQGIIDGRHAIVDAGDIIADDFAVIEGDAARQLRELEPDRIRFWNADGAPEQRRR